MASKHGARKNAKYQSGKWEDKGMYKDATGATYLAEILEVKEDVVVVKNAELQSVGAVDKKTMNSQVCLLDRVAKK